MANDTRTLLFSITAADCKWDTMTAGGPGGQHQNRRHTAVRCTHHASGAVGISREHKSQVANKRAAFARMAQTEIFKNWHRAETARRLSKTLDIEKAVDQAMKPNNLKVEVQNDQGRWTPE